MRRIVATALLTAAVIVGTGHRLVMPADAGGPPLKAAKRATGKPAASFPAFCKEWMAKVWAREQQRVTKWENHGDTVQRTYVEYSRDYQCTLTDNIPPVGKIKYREVWYEKRGKTVAEAEASAPQPTKIFDTGEFFSFWKGSWAP
jgi:hypothetical protein